MTYRSLLVFLDSSPLCAERTQIAVQLARAMDCHLVGVAPTGMIDLPPSPETAALAALAWDNLRDQAEQVAQRFRDTCRALGLKSVETVVDESDQAASIVRHAHCCDLTVLSQAEPDAPGHRMAQHLVEHVVLHSARPTLVIPYAGRFDTIGSNALVAWDDSREAARALSDALPLLRQSKQVQIVCWSETSQDPDSHQHLQRLHALKQWLIWQGVIAEVRTETTSIDIADAMLSRAADLNADLIVMGAYGHARWAERVLGGATRGLLASMTVPVLMSH